MKKHKLTTQEKKEAYEKRKRRKDARGKKWQAVA